MIFAIAFPVCFDKQLNHMQNDLSRIEHQIKKFSQQFYQVSIVVAEPIGNGTYGTVYNAVYIELKHKDQTTNGGYPSKWITTDMQLSNHAIKISCRDGNHSLNCAMSVLMDEQQTGVEIFFPFVSSSNDVQITYTGDRRPFGSVWKCVRDVTSFCFFEQVLMRAKLETHKIRAIYKKIMQNPLADFPLDKSEDAISWLTRIFIDTDRKIPFQSFLNSMEQNSMEQCEINHIFNCLTNNVKVCETLKQVSPQTSSGILQLNDEQLQVIGELIMNDWSPECAVYGVGRHLFQLIPTGTTLPRKHNILIMEKMESDLGMYLKKNKITPNELRVLDARLHDTFQQVINNKTFLCGDIKPGNVLVTKKDNEFRIRFIDFDCQFAKRHEEIKGFLKTGTIGFILALQFVYECRKVVDAVLWKDYLFLPLENNIPLLRENLSKHVRHFWLIRKYSMFKPFFSYFMGSDDSGKIEYFNIEQKIFRVMSDLYKFSFENIDSYKRIKTGISVHKPNKTI